MTTIGDIIAREREARGLSMRELAGMAGISAQAVSAIERGSLPSVRTLARIADALTVRPSWLLKEAGL